VGSSAIRNQSKPKPITRVFPSDNQDRHRHQHDDEQNTDPKARIVGCDKRIKVVIGGESGRPEERFKIEQHHVRLCDQVVVHVRCAGDPAARRHVLHKQQHRSTDQKRRNNSRTHDVVATALRAVRRSTGAWLHKSSFANKNKYVAKSTGKIAAVGFARIAIAAGRT